MNMPDEKANIGAPLFLEVDSGSRLVDCRTLSMDTVLKRL